jgi:type II secretion system protein D
MTTRIVAVTIALVVTVHQVRAQAPSSSAKSLTSLSDSIVVRIVNSDLRAAVQSIAQYLEKPVVFVGGPNTQPVTLETPRPVPRSDATRLLRGLLESHGFELVDDTAARIFRARPREARTPPPGLTQPFEAGRRQAAGPELFVIELHHARALDVAATVNLLFGRGGVAIDPVNPRPPTLSDELRANQIPPAGTPLPQAVPGASGRVASLTGEVTIVADPRANGLLIRANRTDFELIRAAVQQLDVRPLQVLIEVLIVEASRNRSLELGVDASLPPQHVRGTDNTRIGATHVGSAGLGDFVLSVMGLGGVDLDATLKAAASRGEARIVSRPVVLTANNEQAEVVVGSQRPFVQVARALPTDGAVRDQVVQYKDVGTKLVVRPTISTDGSVQLDVVQEVSSATSETAFNAPVISTRSVRTNLLVQDGQTVALGGLTDRQHETQQQGIPVLSSIPILGALFGRASRQTSETELFLFITPRVIRSQDDATGLSDSLRKRAGDIKP